MQHAVGQELSQDWLQGLVEHCNGALGSTHEPAPQAGSQGCLPGSHTSGEQAQPWMGYKLFTSPLISGQVTTEMPYITKIIIHSLFLTDNTA